MSQDRDNSQGKVEKQRGNAQNGGYSRAEKFVLVFSVVTIVALAGLVVYESYLTGTRPAEVHIAPRLEETEARGGKFYLPVEITNRGDRPVTDLRVQFFYPGEEQSRAVGDVLLPTLGGGAQVKAVLVLDDDPRSRALHPTISYIEP